MHSAILSVLSHRHNQIKMSTPFHLNDCIRSNKDHMLLWISHAAFAERLHHSLIFFSYRFSFVRTSTLKYRWSMWLHHRCKKPLKLVKAIQNSIFVTHIYAQDAPTKPKKNPRDLYIFKNLQKCAKHSQAVYTISVDLGALSSSLLIALIFSCPENHPFMQDHRYTAA